MENLEIQLQDGREAARLVDSLYALNGSSGRARPDDLFFLAIKEGKLIGCVRYCVENETPMLRTMQVHPDHRDSNQVARVAPPEAIRTKISA